MQPEFGYSTESAYEFHSLSQGEHGGDRGDGIVGNCPALMEVLENVEIVAPTDSTVLVQGETGTGKELIANALHRRSRRRQNRLIKVNCAAIPSGLLESELFGHERGAFTGALTQRIGRFEGAHRGTLFLDEVGDIPLELQAKLLRVLQEKQFERLGSTRTVDCDVRLVAATHRDLASMVDEGTFRADLYYRLHVFPIRVPALRDRREDIPLLVMHFVRVFASRMNRVVDTVPDRVMNILADYPWPGNIRELQNFIERSIILSPDRTLRAPVEELSLTPPGARMTRPAGNLTGLQEVERDHIIRTLEASNWVLGGHQGAAAKLNVPRTTLLYKMRRLGIEPRNARREAAPDRQPPGGAPDAWA